MSKETNSSNQKEQQKKESQLLRILNSKMILKLLLSLALLLCLLKMPYWYYQLIRTAGTVGFIYFAYLDNKEKIKFTPQLFVIAAIILNPIVKIPFGRDAWQIIDVILSIVLILSIFFEKKLKDVFQEKSQTLHVEIELKEEAQEKIQPPKRMVSEEEYQQAKAILKTLVSKKDEQ